MSANVVELRTPHGREQVTQLLEEVTIRCIDDIHDAAITLARVAQERGLRLPFVMIFRRKNRWLMAKALS